ncbi:MAG: hypothetical protein JXN65_02075 [Clostridia bacterium]|nr:hypothetical protein [Clostridia bacterium]
MGEIKLKLRVLQTTCKKCKFGFESYYLSDFTYGQRLLLSKDGKYYSYINLIEDKVYDEVEDIISIIINHSNIKLSKTELADCLRQVFYLACDTIKGIQIETARGKRRCPKCGTDEIEYCPEDHIFCEEKTFKVVSHNDWNKLSAIERFELIENGLSKALKSNGRIKI